MEDLSFSDIKKGEVDTTNVIKNEQKDSSYDVIMDNIRDELIKKCYATIDL